MKKWYILICTMLFLLLTPSSVFAGSLQIDVPAVEFSITGGLSVEKKVQSTFDSSKVISGTAQKGTEVSIVVYTKDAGGEKQESATYDIEIGASGLFSQTIDLELGENILAIEANKEGYETVSYNLTIKRKPAQIKAELENVISIPGGAKAALLPLKQ